MLVIPAQGRLRQEDGDFKAGLGYIVRPCPPKQQTLPSKKIQKSMYYGIAQGLLRDSHICCCEVSYSMDKGKTSQLMPAEQMCQGLDKNDLDL
jgi:hypothetical protein